MQTAPVNRTHETCGCMYTSYLVEMKHHVVAELAGAEQLPFLGDLEAVGHRDGVEHLTEEPVGEAGTGQYLERLRQTGAQQPDANRDCL